jgi:hypothetical protein
MGMTINRPYRDALYDGLMTDLTAHDDIFTLLRNDEVTEAKRFGHAHVRRCGRSSRHNDHAACPQGDRRGLSSRPLERARPIGLRWSACAASTGGADRYQRGSAPTP